ncbi:MAG: glutamate 5-kinase [Patescibacteria group bacterium]
MSELIILKIGTSSITKNDGLPDLKFMAGVAEQVEHIIQNGNKVIIVSSGAIGCGRRKILPNQTDVLNNDQSQELALKQAYAAIGQAELMRYWQTAFDQRPVSQHLLTQHVFQTNETLENFKNCLFTTLQLGVVPVLNENDAVSTAEIDHKFTDNDSLAVHVAKAVKASKIIILTDTQGLFTDNPSINPAAQLLQKIHKIDDQILALANGKSSLGRGGMRNKLEAINLAMQHGIQVFLTHGKKDRAVLEVFEAEFSGTHFHPVDLV